MSIIYAYTCSIRSLTLIPRQMSPLTLHDRFFGSTVANNFYTDSTFKGSGEPKTKLKRMALNLIALGAQTQP